jgi:hypothetical protein
MITNANVICVDAVDDVEAIVLRCTRTGACAVRWDHARIPIARRFDRFGHGPKRETPLENRRIEPERGDNVEVVIDLDAQKLRSENEIAKGRGRDSRRTLIDRKLLN